MSDIPTLDSSGLDRRTRDFLDQLNSAGGPPMETLTPVQARAVLEDAQKSVPIHLPPADISHAAVTVNGIAVPLIVVKPAGATGTLPAFMFLHGGGWVLGDYATHERFVRDLVHHSGAGAVFVEYSRSPEVNHPVAVEQCYAATQWVAEHGSEIGVDGSRLAVVGNSVGGNLSAVTAILCRERRGPHLRCQILLWPVTDASFDTPSYQQFAEGYFLTRNMMKWFWDSYLPDSAARASSTASPSGAAPRELQGLPPALIQTAEFDVLRDEGEAYARKLDEAGVDVTCTRVNGMIHDYGLLNPLAATPAVQAALRHAAAEVRYRLD